MISPNTIEYKHRDLNWLSFNDRVLQEAGDPSNPLYERIKFLAIFSSNLDEYFRVRVSQLRQIKRVEKSIRKKLALRPNKITKEILEAVKLQQDKFGEIYHNEIIPELEKNGIILLDSEHYNKKQKQLSHTYFEEHVKAYLEVMTTSFETPQQDPFLENNKPYFAVTFSNEEKLGLINIPSGECGRFIEIEENSITFLDDIIRNEMQSLFPNEEVTGIYEVKLSRDAELYIEDEFNGVLAEKIYESLAQRTDGQPTRLLYDASMPQDIQKKIRKLLNLGKIDMMPGGKYHNFIDFFAFPDPTNNPALHAKKPEPVKHRVLEKAEDYFKVIAEKDQAVHFPYMSFDYVEKFVAQAANDPGVEAIKISLYRVADESNLTNCLLQALENGKKVTVFVEAKARFDEENNIIWGRKFEEKGANVIYSYPKIKVHSKILLVVRREEGKLKNYAYIGTGNFNSETSRIYCDHAIFTADKYITREMSRIFSVLEGDLIVPREKRLFISPFSTRRQFTLLVMKEIENAMEGKKAAITAKLNSLEDPEIIEWLYKASNAGVKIRLIVRGFTCLIPGVKGMSENIYITSIVDQFLEHGRIYLFENGGDEKIYFGSADLMTRNLDRRIEVIAPILDRDIAQEFKEILEIQLSDNVKARIQDEEESNTYVTRKKGEKSIRSQVEIYKYLKEKHQN
ncbi:polyphosphate kinase 1 [Antarcticibacterium flavum]|uniref:Polyphosphate kinase n=1 Tax=Antarcticibacterium flavum TaxID=2058175 RepID=A0A5B7X0J3_9FLAO|nr:MULTISPECIES: polyphosphate kinase 1 [Antarcticibacterium]MCM4158862.1 polyphosphate kinase 1 [Antarcticibacterium sp. W02-3]QCY68121.1 polyphosphate kinase 1 [Antarcticibacterium flavum]